MKLPLFLAGALLAPIFAPALVQAQPTPQESRVCTAGSPLNLREMPDGRVIASLANGSRVWLVAPAAGNWQPIATNEYRGYVWKGFLDPNCTTQNPTPPTTPAPEPIPPISNNPSVVPARCGVNDPNLRNIRFRGGLGIYDRPSYDGQQLATIGDGGVIRLDGVSTTDASSVIWQPINHPARGFIVSGQNGVVANVVYCTRFYATPS
ncbi:MAG: hypothetical protein WBC69_15880, partial [Geitlerinemataceae cyanobacterium]